MAKDENEKARIDDGMNFVIEMIENPDFIKGYGQYIKINEDVIVPKYQDVMYSKTGSLHIPELIKNQEEYLSERGIASSNNAIYFLAPISSVISLPSNYQSNRVVLKKDMSLNKIFSITLIAGVQNHGKDDDGDELYSSLCYGFLGYQIANDIKDKNIGRIYEECVNYLNDFITAYKLFRHDHTIHNVTPRTLPGRVEYYVKKSGDVSGKKIARIHDNDIADIWSKRLPNPEEISEISSLTESLPTNKIAHYALRIAERSITNMCLGQYEDCVLNSDRFVELSLRDIMQQELGLKAKHMKKYKNLWSKKHPETAVIQILLDKLHIGEDSIVDKWLKHSRTARNNIVHSLDVKSITNEAAFEALKYNMLIVHLMASRSTMNFEWYKLPPNAFSRLFMSGQSLDS